MISPRQHQKAKLIYQVGVKPPHVCDSRCYEIAAEIAAAEACDQCESHYELIYYNEKHLVSRQHKPGCPGLEATPMAKDVHAIVDGKLVGTDIPVEDVVTCPLGCRMEVDIRKTGTTIGHQPDCKLWMPDPYQETR